MISTITSFKGIIVWMIIINTLRIEWVNISYIRGYNKITYSNEKLKMQRPGKATNSEESFSIL